MKSQFGFVYLFDSILSQNSKKTRTATAVHTTVAVNCLTNTTHLAGDLVL